MSLFSNPKVITPRKQWLPHASSLCWEGSRVKKEENKTDLSISNNKKVIKNLFNIIKIGNKKELTLYPQFPLPFEEFQREVPFFQNALKLQHQHL